MPPDLGRIPKKASPKVYKEKSRKSLGEAFFGMQPRTSGKPRPRTGKAGGHLTEMKVRHMTGEKFMNKNISAIY